MQRISSKAPSLFIAFATATIFMAFYYLQEKGYSQLHTKTQGNDISRSHQEGIKTSSVSTFEELEGVPMDSPKLIDYIRKEMLHPPSNGPYNLKQPRRQHFSQYGQARIVDSSILKGKRNGFFLEVGAVDGELYSNSLYFERELGWTGLLIEPNPKTYVQLQGKGRKAYTVNCALSISQTPSRMKLTIEGPEGVRSEIGAANGTDATKKDVTINTVPLYSLLMALNVSVIDYMSLDIEGAEMKVLQTIPWDKVTIHVMDVEANKFPEGQDYLVRYMEARGYKFLGRRTIDAFFVSSEIWKNVLREVNPLHR